MIRKLNRNYMLILLIALLALSVFLPGKAFAAPDVEIIMNDEVDPNLKLIKSVKNYQAIQAWHNSAGMWYSPANGYRAYDSELKNELAKLEGKFFPASGHKFTVPIPDEIKERIESGEKVVVHVKSSHNLFTIDKMFNHTDKPEKNPFTITSGNLNIMMHPKFNYETGPSGIGISTYEDHEVFTASQIPLVKQSYGFNGFSIFARDGSFRELGTYTSFSHIAAFDRGETIDRIVPKMINADGTLKPGYKIKVDDGRVFDSSNVRIGQNQGVFESGGAFGLSYGYSLEFSFYVEKDKETNMVMRELEIMDESGTVIQKFKRNLNAEDPFYYAKQTVDRGATTPENGMIFDPDKKYKIRAKYQFISFAKGEFDITDVTTMTAEQKAVTNDISKNTIEAKYAYGSNATSRGVFDSIVEKISTDKPNTALKNMEMATFEWDYTPPDNVKDVRIAVEIDKNIYPLNRKPQDDWADIFGRIETNKDIVMKQLELVDTDGTVIESFKREVDPADPFNVSKQKLIRTSTSTKDSSLIDASKTYKLRAEYQFISFMEGKFDINNLSTMTAKQKALTTGVNKNEIDIKYSYDINSNLNGKFDKAEKLLSKNKPNTALKNMETAIFEWSYKMPTEKQELRIGIEVADKLFPLDRNPENDWANVFGTKPQVNMAMAEPVKLYRSGVEVKFLDQNETDHKVKFKVAHVSGKEDIGDKPPKNPKVKVNVVVSDANNNRILSQSVQTAEVLKKGGYIEMPLVGGINGSSGAVKICGTIDPVHTTLGYNSDISDDTICATFMVSKNYAVSDVKITPQVHYLEEGRSYIRRPLSVDFNLMNDSKNETGILSSSVLVRIRGNGSTVWEKYLSAPAGKTTKHSVSLPVSTYYSGDYKITVEVNPNRSITEFKPGVSNPYLDNIGHGSFLVKRFETCIDCTNVRTDNTWSERFYFTEHTGTVRSSRATDSICYDT